MQKYILVTGGTKGIGRAIIEKFAAEGFHIITCARGEKDLEELKIAIERDFTFSKVHYLPVDLGLENERNAFLKFVKDFYSIYSITFIWLVPILISLTPILFAREEIMNSVLRQFAYPFLSVIAFFALALATRLEDLFCILILGLPFFYCCWHCRNYYWPICKKTFK